MITDALGNEVVVSSLGSGDFFGEVALLQSVPRTATTRVVSPTKLLGLSRKDFNDSPKPDFTDFAGQKACQR